MQTWRQYVRLDTVCINQVIFKPILTVRVFLRKPYLICLYSTNKSRIE